MTEPNPDTENIHEDWQNLPILIRDAKGKYLSPLSPDIVNINKRVRGDAIRYADIFDKSRKHREVLGIEVVDVKSVDTLLANIDSFSRKWYRGDALTVNDLMPVATYLDWSYQQQVGIPASSSNINEATKNGIGTKDVWVLFTSIKNKLEK